jgi:hypothetical protein
MFMSKVSPICLNNHGPYVRGGQLVKQEMHLCCLAVTYTRENVKFWCQQEMKFSISDKGGVL